MVKSYQRMGLAATIGEFKLAYRLVVSPCKTKQHILCHLSQVEGGIGEREELHRVAIDGWATVHHHVIQVRREHRKGQFTTPQVVA